MKCNVCEKDFEGRTGAKFCSSTCRSRSSRATDNQSVATDKSKLDTSEKKAWQKVMDGEPSGIDVGFGPNDYTREMVEERLRSGDNFIPNWYTAGAKSRNQVTYGQSKHNNPL